MHKKVIAIILSPTFFLFAMVLNTSTTAAKVDPPQWTFDDKEAKDALKKWVDVNQLKPLELDTVKDGSGKIRSVLKTESLGGDPYMFPGGGWNVRTYEPFNGKEFDTLYIGVRVNKPNRWQVYYITQKDGKWAELQRQNFEVNAEKDFEDIEVKLERGDWNKRTVVGFRIDPGTAAGIEAEIDYISFTGIPNKANTVDAREKLTTTWGKLKYQQ